MTGSDSLHKHPHLPETGPFSIGRFQPSDRDGFMQLWAAYEDNAPPERDRLVAAESNWRALMAEGGALYGLCLRGDDKKPAGFALYVHHFCTKFPGQECYLNDLYVAETCRRKGGGKALLDTLIKECREQGLFRLSWITRPDNDRAQSLYNRYSAGTNYVRYKVPLKG